MIRHQKVPFGSTMTVSVTLAKPIRGKRCYVTISKHCQFPMRADAIGAICSALSEAIEIMQRKLGPAFPRKKPQ